MFFFYMRSPIEDLGDDLPVYTRILNCYELVEKLYYCAGYEAIRVYCGSTDNLNVQEDSSHLPQCAHCSDKEKIRSSIYLGLFFFCFKCKSV